MTSANARVKYTQEAVKGVMVKLARVPVMVFQVLLRQMPLPYGSACLIAVPAIGRADAIADIAGDCQEDAMAAMERI